MPKFRLAFLPLLMALAACSSADQEGSIKVSEAWVRMPAVPDRPGAAYFTITNPGPATVLTKIESARVGRIELHDTVTTGSGGMMRMVPIDRLAVPEGGSVEFKPGGKHAMLFQIDPALQPEGTLPLTFSFEGGNNVEVQASLRSLGAPSPHEH